MGPPRCSRRRRPRFTATALVLLVLASLNNTPAASGGSAGGDVASTPTSVAVQRKLRGVRRRRSVAPPQNITGIPQTGRAANLKADDGTPFLKEYESLDEWHREAMATKHHLPLPFIIKKGENGKADGAFVPPLFLIIGVQKGGTTGLRHNLLRHPMLHGFGGEAHFFDFSHYRILSNGAPRQAILEAYWARLLAGPAQHVRTNVTAIRSGDGFLFDATPSYMYHRGAAPAVYWLLPNVPMVALLRDPIERYISAISMEACRRTAFDKRAFQKLFHEIGRFEDACEAANRHLEPRDSEFCIGPLQTWAQSQQPESWMVRVQRRATPSFLNVVPRTCIGMSRKAPEHILRSMYASQLGWWLALFGEKDPETGKLRQILTIDSAKLFQNESAVVQEVWDFVGLPADENFVYSSAHQRPNGCTGRQRAVFKDLLREMEEAGDFDAMRRCFKPHNERLFQQIGQDLGWNNPEPSADPAERRRRLEAIIDEPNLF